VTPRSRPRPNALRLRPEMSHKLLKTPYMNICASATENLPSPRNQTQYGSHNSVSALFKKLTSIEYYKVSNNFLSEKNVR